MILNLIFFGFIALFFLGNLFFMATAGLTIAGGVLVFLQSILTAIVDHVLYPFSLLFRRKPKAIITTEQANLTDPIGALSLVAQRYNDVAFLKDLLYLEVELFGRASQKSSEFFYQAEKDPRPEVCGACANKILLHIASERRQKIKDTRWTEKHETIWMKGTPKEWRSVVADYSQAS